MNPNTIIISRTDSIGDVMLTLPMCGILKKHFPNVKIVFLAKAYTQAVVESCEHVDVFLNWEKISEGSPGSQIEILRKIGADVIIHVFPRKEILWLAKRAHIPFRVATAGRLYTIGKCNKLVFFSRKKSSLHESQLNLKLLKPLGIDHEYSLSELCNFYGFSKINESAKIVVSDYLNSLQGERRKVILHPLSKGSAPEWGLKNFEALIQIIPEQQFEVFVTGTKEEGEKIREVISFNKPNVHDVTGKFSLNELIELIRVSDLLIAASTGPLHIAAACGVHAIGLYSPKRPLHPGRWSPLGKHTTVFVAQKHPLKGEKLTISPHEILKVMQSS